MTTIQTERPVIRIRWTSRPLEVRPTAADASCYSSCKRGILLQHNRRGMFQGRGAGGQMPRFFLSYARLDAHNEYLTRFFNDLCEAVASRAVEQAKTVGFRDIRDIEVGQSWPDELVDALRTSNSLVALYSPAFFESDFCGREWQIFADRENGYQQQRNLVKPPGLLLPVLWIPSRTSELVPVDTQYDHQQFGEVYATEGLEYMLRLSNRHHDDYQNFLVRFAERLVQVTTEHAMAPMPQRPDIKAVTSAFRREGAGRKAGDDRVAAGGRGPRKAWFVVVAGTAGQLRQVRSTVDAYGADPVDWQPYYLDQDGGLAAFAQAVAGHAGITSAVRPIDQDLIEVLQQARSRNEIVILLVDAWTVRLAEFHELVQAYDQQNLLNTAVLVPWNLEDAETAEQAEVLRVAIQSAFENNCQRRDPRTFRDNVSSSRVLKRELRNVLAETQRRIIERADVARRATSAGMIVKPIVSGPHG
jgi:FxsC-like protein